MKKQQHLANDVLVRLLDDELSSAETIAAELHLDACTVCKQRYLQLEGVSRDVETFAHSLTPRFDDAERDALVVLLNTQAHSAAPAAQKVLQRFVWGMALAASLAMGVLIAPHLKKSESNATVVNEIRQSAALLQVDGETFVPLPYSNPDLPMAAHHIVEMQVPVSSLADAGVHFEAISNEVAGNNESVLADVLLGIDGQPLGVHVLSGQ